MAVQNVVLLLWTTTCMLTAIQQNQVYGDLLPASFLTKSSLRVTYADSKMVPQSDDEGLLKLISSDKTPVRLQSLSLYKTNTKYLELTGLNVESLSIDEENLVAITGDISRVQSLKLKAPELEVLYVSHMRFDLLLSPFGKQVPKLKTIRLLHAVGQPTKGHKLSMEQLTSFTVIQSDLNTLPIDFFWNTPLLEYIDLSANQIKTLPKGLLSAVHNLKTLLLNDNQLTQTALKNIAPVTWLSVLGLSGNPLGDLCDVGKPSALSSLTKLKKLDLSSSKATHLCSDWMKDMRQLSELKFQNNSIATLVCEDLDVRRDVEAVVDLSLNAIIRAKCEQQKAEEIVNNTVQTKGAKVIISSHIDISCGWSFLENVVRSRKLILEHPNNASATGSAAQPESQSACETSDEFLLIVLGEGRKVPDYNVITTFTRMEIKSADDQVVDIGEGYLKLLPNIVWMRLDRVLPRTPPPNVEHLEIVNAGFQGLDSLFFSETLNLKHLDMSNNDIKSLPSQIFLKVTKLESLWLTNNSLTLSVVDALKPLTQLKDLRLSGNNIGEFCEYSKASSLAPLKNLERLELANTGASYLCADWLTDMPQLATLDFRNNKATGFSCTQLDIRRDIYGSAIDLSGNDIKRTYCTRPEFVKASQNHIDAKGTTITIDSQMICTCGWKFLKKVLQVRHVSMYQPRRDLCNYEERSHINCKSSLYLSDYRK